ncbi:hypothetical protein TKK_0013972 [Trichogramma kaykai]|uniref:Centrosomal protein of 135 kDa n=1 Tax=Trichogramma kaykai TaxID=54128 RepID=A0ABD2WF96_9HYME
MSSINDKYSIAGRYRTVRKHLDTLGYKQALSLDSLPLIELLLVDLAETRETMKHYQAIAQNKIDACGDVHSEIDPYKCNNSKLVQECNQLHLELIEAKEENQKLSNDFKKKIRRLECELSDLQASFVKNLQRIKQLETESAEKSKKILELTGKCCKPSVSNANLADRKKSVYPLRRPVLHADPLPPSPKKSINSSCTTFTSNKVEPYMVDFVSMADRRINDMTKQVSDLKEELYDNSEIIESLKSKLSCKEKEITRLRKVLEEGRPYTSDSKKDHCYLESEKSSRYNKEQLLSEKMHLEHQLKESLEKQHEAMTKALKMAKRNEELENQLRCADRMALNAEADCNLTVKENNKRVCKLQKKLEDLMIQVHTLKSELTIQSREAQELRADLEACRLEKTNVQRILENTLEEKKQMTDKFNQLTMTADRLSSGSRCYKEVNQNNMPRECMCRKETEDGSNDKLIHEKNIIIDSLQTTIEKVESERDHYKCEYFKFKELFKKDADKDDNDLWSQVCELRAQVSEKEHTISKLTREKRELVNEKFGLKSKIHTLENQQNRNISPTRTCFCDSIAHGEKLSTSSNSKLERVERERDIAKADVERLIQERDSLRERLQIASASQMSEIRRMCTKLTDTETRLENCERERRELLIAQGGRKAALQGMDEKFDDLKEELKRTKQELTEQRTQYFQLRTLQDQTDQALSDIQGQLAQTEGELSTAIERCKSFERQHQQRDNKIKELQQEISTHRSRMAQIDRDKDQLLMELDEKTEKIAALEREIVFKETQVNSLEQQIRDVSHNKQ